MNPELQAQTDAVIKAIAHLETTLHQDIILATAGTGTLLVVLIIVALFRR